MKKLLILAVAVGLLMAMGVTTPAGFSVYAAYTLSADIEDTDVTMLYVGGQYIADAYKAGLVYGTGDDDASGLVDLTYLELSGAYKIAGDERNQLYVGGMYLTNTMSTPMGDAVASGLLAEVSGSMMIGINMILSGNLGYSLTASAENFGIEADEVSIMSIKASFLFMFSESFGLTLGYDSQTYTTDGTDSTYSDMVFGALYAF
ncbi:MAG: hypothetical protein ACM3WV_02700 [Bacillota bacterium]